MSKGDCANLRTEIKFHQGFKHPYIIKFVDCLQIHNMVYILLDYASNGSLFHYIHPVNGLQEDLALRFLYQTALGIKYLHDQRIIHRDIKPENILLDDAFDIKLCDFGWSCYLDENSVRSTICGTYEYMPPEIVNEQFHTSKVDIWALGILLYEMLHGRAPFKASNLTEIKQEINSKNIRIKKDVSDKAANLLTKLLATTNERYDIDSLIADPAIQDNMEKFSQPLSKEQYNTLITNFYYSKYRVSPEEFEAGNAVIDEQPDVIVNIIQSNGDVEKIKVVVPENIRTMDSKFWAINNLLKKNLKTVKRRNSASIVDTLKRSDKLNSYENYFFGKQHFLATPIIEIALSSRMSIHPSGKIIVFERKIDWLLEFHAVEKKMQLEGKIIFVIYYDDVLDCYVTSSIKYPHNSNMVRKLLNKHFRGKSNEELFKVTNLKDFLFCHKLGLYGGASSLHSAILIADMSLD